MMMNTRKVTYMGSHERMSVREKEKKWKEMEEKKNIGENFFFSSLIILCFFFVSYWEF